MDIGTIDPALLTLRDSAQTPETFADGAIFEDRGETVRITWFSTRLRGAEPPVHQIVHRVVVPKSSFLRCLEAADDLLARRLAGFQPSGLPS